MTPIVPPLAAALLIPAFSAPTSNEKYLKKRNYDNQSINLQETPKRICHFHPFTINHDNAKGREYVLCDSFFKMKGQMCVPAQNA